MQGGSVRHAIQTADAAVKDGATETWLGPVSHLGWYGKNEERDWHRLFKKRFGQSVEPYHVVFDLYDESLINIRPTKVATILIWELLDQIHHFGKKQVRASLTGQCDDGPANWWDVHGS